MTLADFILLGSAAAMAVLFLLVLFEPGLKYRVSAPGGALDGEAFVRLLGSVMNARIFRGSAIEPYTTGESIYAAQLAAIADARSSVHLEAYLFLRGAAGDRFLAALTEAAGRGVKVRVIVDAIGSLLTPWRYFAALRAAGGQVAWYQPIRWYTLKRFNNRTHRELLIVDGCIGFIGGAGIADYWLPSPARGRPWRDTTVRVTGPLVGGLQTSFIENWLEASGEILTGPEEFPLVRRGEPEAQQAGDVVGLVVNSTPSAGRATRARMLFQLFLASARESILINSPYFVPDRSARAELVRAVRRGVKVQVVTPNRLNNHPVARLASRRRYGELIAAGVEIHEYQPTMIHAKVMVVDAVWTILGSTNFDNRSFGLNDEVNLAVLEKDFAADLERDFEADLGRSKPIGLAEWRRRPWLERALALGARVLERQV